MRKKSHTQKQLEELLLELDDDIVVSAVQNAFPKRQYQSKEIREKLSKQGIKIPVGFGEKPFWRSKKFYGGVVALGFLVASHWSPGLWELSLAPLVYIFGQGLADLGKNKSVSG